MLHSLPLPPAPTHLFHQKSNTKKLQETQAVAQYPVVPGKESKSVRGKGELRKKFNPKVRQWAKRGSHHPAACTFPRLCDAFNQVKNRGWSQQPASPATAPQVIDPSLMAQIYLTSIVQILRPKHQDLPSAAKRTRKKTKKCAVLMKERWQP